MRKEVLKVFHYFAYFSYPPTEKEVYTYVGVKITHANLKQTLKSLVKSKKILENEGRYTLGGYGIFFKSNIKRRLTSQAKMKSAEEFISKLETIPFIKLVGISGSLSMLNAKDSDDIDLFIITSQNQLWTARFISILVAQLLGVRRKRTDTRIQDKICMNLFFEETELTLPIFKQNRFTAHEVMQMKPILNKNKTYEKFLSSNIWITSYFPNIRIADTKNKRNMLKREDVGDVEAILKTVQKYLIKRHQTTELILQKQLWFFPQDVQKKLEKRQII